MCSDIGGFGQVIFISTPILMTFQVGLFSQKEVPLFPGLLSGQESGWTNGFVDKQNDLLREAEMNLLNLLR